jgi:hypothetical protein
MVAGVGGVGVVRSTRVSRGSADDMEVRAGALQMVFRGGWTRQPTPTPLGYMQSCTAHLSSR